MHSCIHAFIHPFIHLCIHSFIHLFIYSFIHLFIYSFIHLFIYSFIHLFIYSFIHLFIYSFIHLFIYSFIHLFIFSYSLFLYPQFALLLKFLDTDIDSKRYLIPFNLLYLLFNQTIFSYALKTTSFRLPIDLGKGAHTLKQPLKEAWKIITNCR